MSEIYKNGPLTIYSANAFTNTTIVLNKPFGVEDNRPIIIQNNELDLGKYYTQEQINSWYDLKILIEKGILTAEVKGTIPKVTGGL